MATCTTPQNMSGKTLAVGYAIGCGNNNFLGLTYLPLGSINSKQLEMAANVDDNTSDLSGGFTSEFVINSSFNLTISGFLDTIDSALSAQNALIAYYVNEINAGRQPTVWIKISGPNYPRTWHNFMIFKGISEGHDISTSTESFDFSITNTGDSANKSVNLS